MTDASVTIADQLGLLLQRRVRRDLTDEVIDGVHAEVDSGAYLVLSGVARYGSVSAAVLGAEIGVDRALVSRRAAKLIDAGLLEMHTEPKDRRTHLLRLSPRGRTVIETLRARLVGAIDRRLSSWSADERKQFAERLTVFVASMSDGGSTAPGDDTGASLPTAPAKGAGRSRTAPAGRRSSRRPVHR